MPFFKETGIFFAIVLMASTSVFVGKVQAEVIEKKEMDFSKIHQMLNSEEKDYPKFRIVNSYGKKNAPYTLIIYTALTCAHCQELHTKKMPELIKSQLVTSGTLRILIRDYPKDPASLEISTIFWNLADGDVKVFQEMEEKFFSSMDEQNKWLSKLNGKSISSPDWEKLILEGLTPFFEKKTMKYLPNFKLKEADIGNEKEQKHTFDTRVPDQEMFDIQEVPTVVLVQTRKKTTESWQKLSVDECNLGTIQQKIQEMYKKETAIS